MVLRFYRSTVLQRGGSFYGSVDLRFLRRGGSIYGSAVLRRGGAQDFNEDKRRIKTKIKEELKRSLVVEALGLVNDVLEISIIRYLKEKAYDY